MKAAIITPPTGTKEIGKEGRCGAESFISMELRLPPMALLYPAAVLEEKGIEIKVYDGVIEGKESLKQAVEDADLVCVNIGSQKDLKRIEELRDLAENAHFTGMGLAPTLNPKKALESGFDSVIIGETEKTIEELAKAIEHKDPLDGIKGLAYIENGKVKKNPKRPLIENLDLLPFPNRRLIDQEKYRFLFCNEKYTSIVTGRGCPYDCIFCTVQVINGKRNRQRSAESVFNELIEVKKEGVNNILFFSDNFTADRKFVEELCDKIIDNRSRITWICNSRVGIQKELMQKMHKAGCGYIGFGIESGSQKILDNAKKGISLEMAEKTIKDAGEVGIESIGYFIIGMPGDTEGTARETIEFAKKIGIEYAAFRKMEVHDKAGLYSSGLSEEEMERLLKQAYKEFYLRPGILIREMLKTIKRGEYGRLKMGLETILKAIS